MKLVNGWRTKRKDPWHWQLTARFGVLTVFDACVNNGTFYITLMNFRIEF